MRHQKLSRRQFIRQSSLLLSGTALFPVIGLTNNIFKSPLKFIENNAFTMGSFVSIKAFCRDEKHCLNAINRAINEMKNINKLMNIFDDKSQLSLVNKYAGRENVEVDTRIIELCEAAKRYNEITLGSFDVTIEPLMKLYGFRDEEKKHRYPTDKEILQTIESVGIENIIIDKSQSKIGLKHPQTKLDFGGIAVGYAVDTAVNILESNGIEAAIINHSGDIYAIGSPPDENYWEVGIVDPNNPDEIIKTAKIKDQALSTSGNYQNYIQTNEHMVGHILNPKTGRTAANFLSSTVIANAAIEADALSTGLFNQELDCAKKAVKYVKNARFIAIMNDKSIVDYS